ncbi:MAG: acyl-CoA dehydrogenase family protein [Thermoplasmatota archaeon]
MTTQETRDGVPAQRHATRDVIPATPATGENWYEDDATLGALLARHLEQPALKEVQSRAHALGALAPARLDALARLADRHAPVLHVRSPEGVRVDDVEFHPSYRELQALAREHEVFTYAWHGGSRLATFALGYLYAQAESGYYCPACMTDGAAFVLSRHAPEPLGRAYLAKLVQRDPRGAFEGAMYLTEKGGGSDVGAGTATRAEPAADGSWRLTGEKWFASNCVADVALALARVPTRDGVERGGEEASRAGTAGLGLFLVPRTLADGTRNPGVRLERLKDKLGVRSMPTGEVVLEGAYAELVAPPPLGFKAMAEMVNLSRLYNAVASVGVARRALREAQRAARARLAFGRPLAEQPLFARELAALACDLDAALAVTFETAATFDRFAGGARDALPLLRALTPLAKAMTARLAVDTASQACEMLGGVGYIEDYVTPRLLRDAQVLPIWEGTTNVQALEFASVSAKRGGLASLTHLVEQALTEVEAPLVRAALADVAHDATQSGEAGALRVLARAYHTVAAALLVRLAEGAAEPRERFVLAARVYAERHLSPDAAARERAVERLTDRDARLLAGV